MAEVQAQVAKLNEEKNAAVAEKERVEAEAEACLAKLALAERSRRALALTVTTQVRKYRKHANFGCSRFGCSRCPPHYIVSNGVLYTI